MSGREMTCHAIEHRAGLVPQLIGLTPESAALYGDRLLARYAVPTIQKLYDEGCLSRLDAIELAVGNHVARVRPPWWDWHGAGEAYRTEDTPAYVPTSKGNGSYEAFFAQCTKLYETLGCYMLAVVYGSHFEKAYFARGIENFLADMAAEPDCAQALLDHIIEKNLVMLENMVSVAQIHGVLLGSDWGSQRGLLMSPAVWRRMIRHGEEREYKLIHQAGLHVWVHSCGDIRDILPDLCELGVDVLNPLQPECMDIYELKRLYGGRMTFWGGISTQQTLPFGTPDQVRRETRAVLEAMSAGGGYIASPAQELQGDVPYENIVAMLDTMKEFATP